MNLLDRIKELCLEKKISQRKLESNLGLSNGATSKWGKSSPSADVLEKVADYFGVSTDYLLGKIPFRNEDEAYYSISVASIKYLMANGDEIPDNYGIDSGLIYLSDKNINRDIWNYCYNLLNKFEKKLSLTDLDLFELSNIIFSEIKWTKDFSGLVYLKNYNDETITIKLNFNKVNKLNADDLNLKDSFLLKSMDINDNSFLRYNSVLTSFKSKEKNNMNNRVGKSEAPATIAAHLPEGEELTEEEQKQLNDYIQFLLSKREK
ncbi:helix-turn-helix domain-containing protein [Sporanaerobacter sp. PP17-6a]|uniref:helix-turn-helix domain-containing protein n=1 Tax=Sporanaerobacter sp. PP17-6a TaxID=1891289 RepID=UPI00089FCA1E|nr:helix-turn-helix transcriptional regulator [Sporanaerobacter sp. PP17-6a]SCL87903.1 putative PBSX repressor [Sporanaerobacter sp. PP17-6a]